MRITAAIVALACAAATTASAQPGRLSDVDYLKAARCAGLAASTAGGADSASLDAVLKAQRIGRVGYIQDKADETKTAAKRAADRAGDERKPALMAELAGACQRYVG